MQKALKKLGISPSQELSIELLIGESFNGHLYGMDQEQIERVQALRDVVLSYENSLSRKTTSITCPAEAAKVMYHRMKSLGHEEVAVVFLNAANRILHSEFIFKGSLSQVLISSRDIIAKALSANAAGIILYHFHPSGNPLPSKADIIQTDELKKACDAIGVNLIDHIIISKDCYYSFSEEKIVDIK